MYNIIERVPEFKEEWRRVANYIPEFRDIYLVSNKGNIFNDYTNRPLKPKTSKKGYLDISLLLKDSNKSKQINVRRLVMICFNPIADPQNYLVNNILGLKEINDLPLLEWKTQQEMAILKRERLMRYNYNTNESMHNNATITDQQAHQICFYLQFGFPFKYISNVVLNRNLDKSASDIISSIRNKRHFKHISSQYNIDNTRHALHAFSDEQAIEIYNCCKSGMDCNSILKHINYNTEGLPQDVIEKLYFDIDCIRIKDRYKYVLNK